MAYALKDLDLVRSLSKNVSASLFMFHKSIAWEEKASWF